MSKLSYKTYTRPEHKEWIVFIHGAGGSSKTFGRQIAAFRKHFNLLLPDLRDHGESVDLEHPENSKYSFEIIAKDVIELLKQLEINQAHFMGVSLGSIIIRVIEDLEPDIISSVIIGGGVAKLNRRTHFLFKTGFHLSYFIPFIYLYRLLAWILMPYENHKAARRLFVREASKIKEEAFRFWLELFPGLKMKLDGYFNKPMKSPTLIITGSQDFAFLEDMMDYANKFPFIHHHILPKCGHVCNIEQAEEFNQTSLNFLLKLQR